MLLRAEHRGFTLLELLVTIAIVGILASIGINHFKAFKERAAVAQVASNLKNFGTAFIAYSLAEGDYPPDSHGPPPAEMNSYLSLAVWNDPTPLGGNYNWEGPDSYPYAGISLFGVTADVDVLESLDAALDDGNLGVGRFRQTPNGRYTYILEE
ncbi:MAG: type II secretion system protein [Bdellovibrionales bacterium]|nr:type II secretion system protein [Bdellovibrionales bacterium]